MNLFAHWHEDVCYFSFFFVCVFFFFIISEAFIQTLYYSFYPKCCLYSCSVFCNDKWTINISGKGKKKSILVCWCWTFPSDWAFFFVVSPPKKKQSAWSRAVSSDWNPLVERGEALEKGSSLQQENSTWSITHLKQCLRGKRALRLRQNPLTPLNKNTWGKLIPMKWNEAEAESCKTNQKKKNSCVSMKAAGRWGIHTWPACGLGGSSSISWADKSSDC